MDGHTVVFGQYVPTFLDMLDNTFQAMSARVDLNLDDEGRIGLRNVHRAWWES